MLDVFIVKSRRFDKYFFLGNLFGFYFFIDILEGREEFDDEGYCSRNLVEVVVVLKIVRNLFKGIFLEVF